MAYTKDSLQRLFQSKFNLTKWQMVLQDYFRADKVRKSPEALDEDDENRKGYFLGETTTKDGYKMGFFYYDMEDGSVLRRKVGLRNLVRPYLGYGFDAALAVFDDGKNWRLSLICDLKSDAEATNAKRFTYVFGDEKAFYKTPVKRFVDLQKKADEYLEIKNAFSVEALSDDFFDEYRKQYAEFVKFLTGKVYVKKGNKWIEQEVGEPDEQFFTSFGKDEKLVRDYIKKMMGRIVFLYFLQSKGWLAGNLHYMHDLFDNASDNIKADFLDKVLEPMFFGLLNTKPEDRATAPLVNGVGVKYIPHAEAIPYLNGGLFQQEQIDEVDSRFPAEMFQSLFDFFDSYNFTIDENDPNDAEVGVDPEMLGKIFENLLEDNKDKGAFYTPKEIVRYMCQESLIAYLQTGIEDEETKKGIANFVKTNDVEELGGASSDLAMSIDQKLKDVKICDPAIGSGAFPMGLLRELYACRKAIEVFESDNAADIKRHIIQNNIYGVDIEKGAVDIARLRFWLALIIDEKEPMPLPNLDFKIMQGNSLLESYMGVDLNMTSKKVKTGRDTKKTRGVLSLGFEETDVQKTIQDLVKSYFSITDHTLRAQRRKEIDKYVKDYIKICAEGNQEVQAAVDELEIPNSQFFLWHTYFNDVFEKGGFDIVIGNPPYIQLQNDGGVLANLYQTSNYETFTRTGDIYCLFYERALQILRNNGSLCYITSNKWLRTNYGQKTRAFLLSKANPRILIDFAGVKIFESASVDTNILLASKSNNRHETLCFVADKSAISNILNVGEMVERDGAKCKFSDTDSWIILSSVEQSIKRKIEYMGKPLNKWLIDINYGIKTGCNNAFIINTLQRNNIISNCQTSDERIRTEKLIQPILRGRDIQKYSCDWKQLWLINVHNGIRGIKERIHIENYPSIKAHLDLYLDKLSRRADKGDTPYNLRNCAYIEDFSKPKILFQEIVQEGQFYYDSDGKYFCNDTGRIIVGENLTFLLGILNSKLFYYAVKHFYGGGVLGENGVRMKHTFFQNFSCIPYNQKIDLLAKELTVRKEENLENQIDFLVYHLYGLTYDEVLIVDPNTPITREEYEAYKGE